MSSFAYDIRISISLHSHKKFRRLKRFIGPMAMEYLVRLWTETAKQSYDGQLRGWDAEDVADCIGYDKDPTELVERLVAERWLDKTDEGFSVHDWAEHQPHIMKTPIYSQRGKKGAAARWSKDAPSNAPSMPEAEQAVCDTKYIQKLFHKTFARTANSNDYKLFKVIESFSVEDVDAAFKAAKGKTSLKYVTTILENLPEKKDTTSMYNFLERMED